MDQLRRPLSNHRIHSKRWMMSGLVHGLISLRCSWQKQAAQQARKHRLNVESL